MNRVRLTSMNSHKSTLRLSRFALLQIPALSTPQWGAADAEIKVPSVENTELTRSPFKACRSV